MNYPQELSHPIHSTENIQTFSAENIQTQHSATLQPHHEETVFIPAAYYPSRRTALINSMRLAWEQHINWTRMLIVSITDSLKDEGAVTSRILQNPKDIARIFALYYPTETAKKLEQLLTEHLKSGGALITTMRDGNSADAEAKNRIWYANADQIAEFFGSINPYYNSEMIRKMFHVHLYLLKQIVAARLAGNYSSDIADFDKAEQEMLSMADYLTSGIMRQFPQKF